MTTEVLAVRDNLDLTTRQARKNAWQRRQRAAFAAQRGYSTAANYADGGLREAVFERDGRACVRCGMTAAEHVARWGRPITVDHIDKDRSHNDLSNLQTLCLVCHGRKDLIPRLRAPRIPQHKTEILAWRAAGETYDRIAARLGVSAGRAVWRWVQRWKAEAA